MKNSRVALASLLSLAVLALVADPVAAQTSTTSNLINQLNEELLIVAIPITLLTEGILIYTVWRFSKSDEAKPTMENRRLEISWTIATAIVLLFVGVASYGVLANDEVTFQAGQDQVAPDENDVLVQAEAFQWGWEMTYPRENVTSGTTIVVPEGQDVYIRVTSRDVLHAFHVPEMGLKQDAMPGEPTVIKTTPLEQGTYQGYCAEFCGVAHSQMYFTVEVVSQEDYDSWLQEQQGDNGSEAGGNSSASLVAAAN
ncbi:MAG: cytochrome c oxidase subunit II [Halobacteriota archaeon]